MSDSLFSQSWYRVSTLRPKLRQHVQIHRHRYRGNVWYMVQDHSTGQFFRFSPEAYVVVGLMEGESTVAEIWNKACEILADNMPTQDEVIFLISRLYQANVLTTDISGDSREWLERFQDKKRRKIIQAIKSPLSIRIPLLDPEKYIGKTQWLANAIFSWPSLFVWLTVIISAMFLLNFHWSNLTSNMADRILSLENIFLIGLVYPVVKLIHEFGHAYAVKRWGGEVHEMGILFLVFMPVPYVDASSSTAFRDKRKRMVVAAAGILVELFLASVALIVWANVEQGVVRSIAYNTMLISGISTVFFNGNPLLRFDAYYVLSDYLEIPNMGGRSNKHIGYLIQRYILGVKEVEKVAHTKGEAYWLFSYSIAAFIYRMFIMFIIVVFVAGKFFFIGVLLAIWAAVAALINPLVKVIYNALKNGALRSAKPKLIGLIVGSIAAVVLLLLVIPMPLSTNAQGVVWASSNVDVRSAANCFTTKLHVSSGAQVTKGQKILTCDDPELLATIGVFEARKKEYEYRRQAQINDRAQYKILEGEVTRIDEELSLMKSKLSELVIKSHLDGTLVFNDELSMVGRFIRRGESIAYILHKDQLKIRSVVLQDDADRVRLGTKSIEVRFASDYATPATASIVKEVPMVSNRLPSVALTIDGGGEILQNPQNGDALESFHKVSQFELASSAIHELWLGQRVYIKFRHAHEPLGYRLYRSLRQLLLSQFEV